MITKLYLLINYIGLQHGEVRLCKKHVHYPSYFIFGAFIGTSEAKKEIEHSSVREVEVVSVPFKGTVMEDGNILVNFYIRWLYNRWPGSKLISAFSYHLNPIRTNRR